MTFDVAGQAYGRFMGRYSEPLAGRFADWVDPRPGDRALDVGCGPGALTARLVDRLGVAAVSAVEPSAPFRASVRARLPELEVRSGTADRLPFPDDAFDHTFAQLVVHFMPDPVAGLVEMARVTTPGGWVSTCVWDLAGDRAPISPLWQAARDLDPGAVDESGLPGTRHGDLARLTALADLVDITTTELEVTVAHPSFEQWWEPFTLGVGPAGDYVAGLQPDARSALRERCRALLPPAPFEVTAVAWAVRGRV